jgi:DNA helicase II / ATP-dependent DNA helicase PcrA
MRRVPAACEQPVRFMLSVEISAIYRRGERTRKVHQLDMRSAFEAADRITGSLAKAGNLGSDGRPILGLDSRDLLEITLQAGPGCYLVPAHIWTPRSLFLVHGPASTRSPTATAILLRKYLP